MMLSWIQQVSLTFKDLRETSCTNFQLTALKLLNALATILVRHHEVVAVAVTDHVEATATNTLEVIMTLPSCPTQEYLVNMNPREDTPSSQTPSINPSIEDPEPPSWARAYLSKEPDEVKLLDCHRQYW